MWLKIICCFGLAVHLFLFLFWAFLNRDLSLALATYGFSGFVRLSYLSVLVFYAFGVCIDLRGGYSQ